MTGKEKKIGFVHCVHDEEFREQMAAGDGWMWVPL
jgi:hypothetical protein